MKHVGIICGGYSSEFDISVKSAKTIQQSFPKEYCAHLIYLKKEGWFIEIDNKELPFDSVSFTFQQDQEECKIDLAVVYIHGDPGENGKVQAFLDMKGIPYLNSAPLASQLSFDKWYCNQFLKGFGIHVADSVHMTTSNKDQQIGSLVETLGLPLFIKPCDSGSSYGIAKVSNEDQLKDAVDAAFSEGQTVVAEAFLDGVEVTCGAYRNKKGVVALPLTEIVSENDFFDFEAKYAGLSEEITPARISDELTEKVQEQTLYIYELLGLKSIARVDFMIVDNEPHVIEVNTTPGFSAESIVPKMLKSKGMTATDLWKEILEAEYRS